jgi:predicted MFS family arabinose efflux permease
VDRRSITQLRAQRGYGNLLSAATLARVSDEMFSVGVVLLVLDRTHDAALAGLVVAAITLPSLVTAPLLGAWLDLTGRRRWLMVMDQLIITSVLIALVAAVGNAPNWTLPLIVVAAGLTYPLSYGGFTSFIPVLVPDELLAPANAIEASSFNTALVIGPALAGTIAAVAGPQWSLVVEAALSLAALALIMRIPGLDRPGEGADGRTLLGVVADGLRQIMVVPELRSVTVAGALALSGLGLLTVAFPFFAVDHLGGARADAGYLWAAFAAGSMIGALTLVRLQRRFAPERIVLFAYVLFGVLMMAWPLAGSLPVMLAMVAIAAVADGPALAAQFAVRQQMAPARLRGQVFTTAAGLKIGAFSLGAALAGPAVSGLGSAETLVVAAIIQIVAAAIGLMLGRTRGRERTRAEALG